MIDPKTIQEIQDAPVDERFRSIKQDMQPAQPKPKKKFTVRAFNLGAEVHVDRDELYDNRIA